MAQPLIPGIDIAVPYVLRHTTLPGLRRQFEHNLTVALENLANDHERQWILRHKGLIGKLFNNALNVRRLHRRPFRFVCNIPGCGASETVRDEMKRHSHIVHPGIPFNSNQTFQVAVVDWLTDYALVHARAATSLADYLRRLTSGAITDLEIRNYARDNRSYVSNGRGH